MSISDFDFSKLLLIVLFVIAIKSTLLAAFASFGMKLARSKSTTARHQVAKFVLWSMLLMPGLIFLIPSMPLPQFAINPGVNIAEAIQPNATAIAKPFSSNATATTPKSNLPAREMLQPVASDEPSKIAAVMVVDNASNRTWAWPQVLAGTYLVVAFAFLVRTMLGLLHCLRVVGNAASVQLAEPLESKHPVFESDRVSVPVTIGFFQPKIVLPQGWSTWDQADVAMAIAHESSHIERRDTITKLLASVNCGIYWFHPLSWMLSKRLAVLAEHVCDDAVIRNVGARHEYAQCLVRMASKLSESPTKVSLGVGMARTALVEQRVVSILDSNRKLATRRGQMASALTLAIVGSVAALLSAVGGFADSNDDDPIPAGAITGIVLMPDGSPASGADVFLSTWAPPSIRASTTANQKGRFVFSDFPEGVHRITATKGNLSTTQRWGGQVFEIGVSNFEIKLLETSTLKVNVVDSNTGQPIPKAVVEISRWFHDWQQTANGSGVATYIGLPQEKWEVTVKAKGFALESQEIVVSEAETEMNISLGSPGADLVGTVTDPDGKPVARATVFVTTADESYAARDFHQQVRTDDNGNYQFASLPINKKLEVRAAKDGFVEPVSTLMLKFAAGGEQRHDIALKPIPHRKITGVVSDSDGNPIAGATVRSKDFRRGPKCTTDESGKYELVGQLDGHCVLVLAKGYVSQQLEIDPQLNEKSLDVRMSAGRRVTGMVVNAQREPLANVTVRASKYADVGWIFMPWDHCKTKADGTFEIDSLPSNAKLDFSKRGYSSVDNLPFPDSGDELTEPVQLVDAGLIRGKVVDKTTGKPVTSFRAYYTWSKVVFPGDPKGSMSMASHRGDLFANAAGAFEFDGFLMGMPLQVTVEVDGYKKCVVDRIVAEAYDAAKPRRIELEKVDPKSLTEIVGRIVDEEDKGIAGVEVVLIASAERNERDLDETPHGRDRDEFPYNWEMIFSKQVAEDARVDQFFELTTDADGKFSFSNVQSNLDIEIAYWSDGVARSRFSQIEKLSVKEQQSINIVALQSGTVRGSIDTRKNPHASPTIKVGDIRYVGEISDDGKTFEIKGVPPGKHEVLIHGNPQPLKIPGREDDGAFTTSVIMRIVVLVKPGKLSRADVAGDRM